VSAEDGRRLAALQYHDFRLMWAGNFVSVVGSQMQLVAINWHVYRLLAGTSVSVTLFGREVALGAEALGLGGVGLARVIPIMIFAIIGGALADTANRRTLLIVTNGIAGLLAAVLALLSFTQRDTVLAIYLLTAAGAATAAFSSPAQQALIPNLVPRADLTNAISLNSTMRHIATIGGPALAGLIIGAASESWVYAINAVSFAAVIVALSLLHYSGRVVQSATSGLGWSAIVEGWRFVRGSRIIWSSMMLDFMATFFSSARTMLPLVAGEILKVGAQGYGLLSTAEALGAVTAGAALSLRRDIYRQGVVLLSSVALYGAATAFFGLSTSFALSYLLFMVIGGADTVSMVIRQTIRQSTTPDRLRGRMTGINQIFFMGGPQLGELEAGIVASIFGVPFAIVSGGLATVALTALIAQRYPRLRTYTRDTMTEDEARMAESAVA
jgi:MFS family permease